MFILCFQNVCARVSPGFQELLNHELTRFDMHLNSIRYHVNLGIDYDSRGNIMSRGGFMRGCCMFPFAFG